MRRVLPVMIVLGLAAPAVAKDGTGKWSFAVSRGGKAVGRLDVGLARADDKAFAAAAFFDSAKAIQSRKGMKPRVRSYAELEADGTLGKYKRWEPKGKGSLYWMAFSYEGKIKLRFENGPGDKGKVKELGAAEKVVPLDREQPQLAYLLVRDGRAGEVACAGANPGVLGKGHVARAGDEEVDLYGGGKATLSKWAVTGDCGEFQVYVDGQGEPVVMAAGATRYDRLPGK